jgi:preprotein translocase subunit SecY
VKTTPVAGSRRASFGIGIILAWAGLFLAFVSPDRIALGLLFAVLGCFVFAFAWLAALISPKKMANHSRTRVLEKPADDDRGGRL